MCETLFWIFEPYPLPSTLHKYKPPHQGCAVVSIVPGFEDSRVADLINPSTRTWDINLVHGLLSPKEAALVLSIPLSRTLVEDKIIWPFTPSGNYTVNSGSKFLAKLTSLCVPAGNT